MTELCFEGALSVKSVINHRSRTVSEVWIDKSKDTKDIDYIVNRCKARHIALKRVDAESLAKKAKGKTHGGIIAFASPRIYDKLEDLNLPETPFLALIEGVEDPFNLGYCIRTLRAAGCDGIFLAQRDWTSAEETLMKSSAGTFDELPILQSEDLGATLKILKQKGITIVSALRTPFSKPMTSVNLTQGLLLCIGGEMRGLSRAVVDATDLSIVIPYPSTTKVALNAVSATAVLAFEVVRQRAAQGKE
jgi:23S rRNA (guanosine2251-2'-O)-methyltransferase